MGATAWLSVAQYEIELLGSRDALKKQTTYAGQADFAASGLSLKALVDSALESFELSLPSTVPDLVFYQLRVSAVTAPDEQRSFRFVSLSQVVIPNPLGLTRATLSFDQLLLSLCRQVNPAPAKGGQGGEAAPLTWTTSLSVSAAVTYTPSGGGSDSAHSLGLGNASLALADGAYAIGLEISAAIDPAKILSSVLGVTIQPDVATFLPSFRPLSPTQPIRVYQASKDFSCQRIALDGSLSTVSYSAGFVLDQLVISVLDLDFLVSLVIAGGSFSLAANCPVVSILPGSELLRITGPATEAEDAADFPRPAATLGAKQNNPFGPRLFVSSSAKDNQKEIGLHAYLNFFPNGTVQTLLVAFGYSFGTDRLFTGSVTYDGTIAGISNPTLGFAWSHEAGFRITQFPFDQGALSDALDWASQLKQLANAAGGDCEKGCQQIADLAFNELIQTSFDLKFKPKSGGGTGQVLIEASGTYTLRVGGQSISDISFAPIDLVIDIPKGFDDLASALLRSLRDSAAAIALGLWNNKSQLAQLFAIVTVKEGGEAALCRFACQVGRDALQKAFQALIDALAEAAAAAAESLAAAAAVVVAATGVLDAIARALKWVWDKLTGADERKRDEAQAQKDAAEQKIRTLLTIPSSSAVYQQAPGNGKRIRVSWGDIPAEKNPSQGSVYYVLSVSYPGHSRDIRIDRSGSSPRDSYSYDLYKPDVLNGQTISIGLRAHYDYGDNHYDGPTASSSVPTPILQTPAPQVSLNWQSYEQLKHGVVQASWSLCGVTPTGAAPGVSLTAYDIVFKNTTTSQILSTVSNTASGSQPPATTFSYQLYADDSPGPQGGFAPNPNDQYQIVVTARASDSDLDSPSGVSQLFAIPWGIGYMRIGFNFRVKG